MLLSSKDWSAAIVLHLLAATPTHHHLSMNIQDALQRGGWEATIPLFESAVERYRREGPGRDRRLWFGPIPQVESAVERYRRESPGRSAAAVEDPFDLYAPAERMAHGMPPPHDPLDTFGPPRTRPGPAAPRTRPGPAAPRDELDEFVPESLGLLPEVRAQNEFGDFMGGQLSPAPDRARRNAGLPLDRPGPAAPRDEFDEFVPDSLGLPGGHVPQLSPAPDRARRHARPPSPPARRARADLPIGADWDDVRDFGQTNGSETSTAADNPATCGAKNGSNGGTKNGSNETSSSPGSRKAEWERDHRAPSKSGSHAEARIYARHNKKHHRKQGSTNHYAYFYPKSGARPRGPKDRCPIHGKHRWALCKLNPDNEVKDTGFYSSYACHRGFNQRQALGYFKSGHAADWYMDLLESRGIAYPRSRPQRNKARGARDNC